MGVVLPKKAGKRSGNWQVTFQYKGRKYSFSSGSPIREVAEAMEPGFRAQVEREHAALSASGPAVTFNEAMGAYYRVRIEGASKEGKTPEEIEEFELAGFDALAYAGQLVGLDTRCADVDTTRMIEIVQHLKNGKIGSASGKRKAGAINKRTQLIFAVLNFARDHLATPLPNRPRMREVRLPEGERHRIIDYRDEADICAHLEDMLQLAFVLELETGIRRGDVVGLKWDRVTLLDGSDGEYGQILAHVKSKGRQLYPVPLNARAAEILRMLKGLHPEYIFTRVVQTRRTAHGRTTMVTTRAPTIARLPLGLSAVIRMESETPLLGGSKVGGFAPLASGASANKPARSALNTVGPSDQFRRLPPSLQWIQSAPSPLTLTTGRAPPLVESETSWPPGTIGVTKAW